LEIFPAGAGWVRMAGGRGSLVCPSSSAPARPAPAPRLSIPEAGSGLPQRRPTTQPVAPCLATGRPEVQSARVRSVQQHLSAAPAVQRDVNNVHSRSQVLPEGPVEDGGIPHPQRAWWEVGECDGDGSPGLTEVIGPVDHPKSLRGSDDQTARGGCVRVHEHGRQPANRRLAYSCSGLFCIGRDQQLVGRRRR